MATDLLGACPLASTCHSNAILQNSASREIILELSMGLGPAERAEFTPGKAEGLSTAVIRSPDAEVST